MRTQLICYGMPLYNVFQQTSLRIVGRILSSSDVVLAFHSQLPLSHIQLDHQLPCKTID